MGRPSTYSDELFEKIRDRMGHGETLVQISHDEQMPDRSTA